MSYAKARMHRRSFLKSMSSLLAVSGQPGVFQLLRTAKGSAQDTTCVLVGPDNSRPTVLAHTQIYPYKIAARIYHSIAKAGDTSRDGVPTGTTSGSNSGSRSSS